MSENDFKDRVEKGSLVTEGVFGERPPEGQENCLLSDMVMATAYADIQSKPCLGLRDRSLKTFIVLAVQEHEKELRAHLRGAANQGVSRLEAEEMMMHISIYIGWPKALEARRIMTEVFDELKIS